MTVQIGKLARVSLTVSDLDRMIRFYEEALGFSCTGQTTLAAQELARLGLGCRATRASLLLGQQELELLCPETPGRPYPPQRKATDAWFQHLAIVVGDMPAAYARISAEPITPISIGGPQELPPSSGGVTAFKFRDPEGHPLELLNFPPGAGATRWQDNPHAGLFLGIDHSAITVADVARSIAFYEGLGLRVSARSLNHGAAQDRLDGLPGVRAQVVALCPPLAGTPHVELLGYERPPVSALARPLPTADIAAARFVFSVSAAAEPHPAPRSSLIHDPDGHAILLDSADPEEHSSR
ncbi:VOC family protein [Acidisoma sp. C75]